MTTRRSFLRGAAAAAPAALAAPAVVRAQSAIKWRWQTYAGAALGEHVTKPIVDYINNASNGELEVELFYADQIVPTGELFQALQRGTIDAVHSDDDSMASPTPLRQFGGYFPFATKHILDVPVLFNQYGLKEIWEEEYAKVGVKWLSAAGQDPCNFNTKKEITSVADLDGLKLYTFPTAGRFLAQFGVVPMNIPYEDAEVAVQTGELDGMAWSGITEDYTVGWANVTDYFLTNNISGAWIGSYFVNEKRWADLPEHLKAVVMSAIEAGHTYRNQWYWGGEAKLRATGDQLELRTVPAAEWAEVENAAKAFWEEIAQEGEIQQKIVNIFKEYNGVINQAGPPYTNG
ncbi:TRAP transporter substrate-binding protein [Pseudooceanicola nitratireducens]|jgi:TRAP-type mannitol/chloroaromatic compound transport system substrate-binding protein|uniref:TRAP-type mannitol/chloroaromatic compound transport system, substrate-binding protein n=1 Tax=Pseudooceanicola nitratireducens TaxID=517719 RepID=A0A1I1J1E8_9RHOB|nr:TRAP transporter substrate-binding protein [Pseudooceanicola nitratireducens]MEC7297335.1 TRAP transporter substrate-binding protein [Pseudomonadota bacterium]MBY6158941.1 TRAP transporter substrate-binding protein [Pseudooceanicola nitratireducens]MEC7794260.1 TRAP transporter substrate-binding protein [Pseudomonadota bacterium]MEC8669283.1 TRAP transporter substrate-binding protein [Pseudomonadota bacterium]SEJ28239.1 TRAP-type mannitol/chloroaromatic compound transport system, substrate-